MFMKKSVKYNFTLTTLNLAFCFVLSGRATAQTFATLYSFSETHDDGTGISTNGDGANPQAGLVLSGHTLYGTSFEGGTNGNGTVFAINTDGTGFTNLHTFSAGSGSFNFTNGDGAFPSAGLIFQGNKLYGTASRGGAFGSGTVFAINTDGTGFTNLYFFTTASSLSSGYTNSDGAFPLANLILCNGTLYGTTVRGGIGGSGTVFAIRTDGSGFSNLYSFEAISGSYPYVNSNGGAPYAPLVMSRNTLYGTTAFGGSSGVGTVFAINTDGTGFTNLHTFISGNASDGAYPYAGLILRGNTLYGTTYYGGIYFLGGTVFSIETDGTGFTLLHSFNFMNPDDGASPYAGLILSGDTLYGTTYLGASYATDFPSGNGKIFAVSTDGTGYTNLYTFTEPSPDHFFTNSDGGNPSAGLILSGSSLYGMATSGGSSGNGTIFSLRLDHTRQP